jgi:AcrR family transcriptional regulator
MELALERGLDNVQMKLVAERAGVALGTTYRYFVSKEHLLASALAEWHRRLTDRVLSETTSLPPESQQVDRLVHFLHRGLRGFQRSPNYAALLIYVLSSRDPFASEALTEMSESFEQVLRSILGGVPDEQLATLIFIIGSIWYNSILTWSTGRHTLVEAFRQVENAVRLLLSADVAGTGLASGTGAPEERPTRPTPAQAARTTEPPHATGETSARLPGEPGTPPRPAAASA